MVSTALQSMITVACVQAVESKYNSLQAVNSHVEGELIRLKHGLEADNAVPLALPCTSAEPSLNLQALLDMAESASSDLQHNG